MISIISNTWALFLGMGLIMLGNGLQGSLLGIRATQEGFSTTVTGLVMSGYFIGLIAGCYLTPAIIGRVGHVRVFGAFASLASVAILVHGVWPDPLLWWMMRIVTGLSYAGLYIVAESWLNDSSSNESRGKTLSIYMIISLGGLSGGQFLLNLASPKEIELFILSSLLISLAVVPILVSATRGPNFESVETVSVRQLFQISPLGVFGMLVSGICMGAVFGMGSVYTTQLGLSVKEVAIFMSVMILGGFISQYPLGWLSDRFGRRGVILVTCGLASGFAAYASFNEDTGWTFLVLAFAVGSMIMPLYSLCSAHTNDYLSPTQMVAASGTLVLINASGATIGSPLTAFFMDNFGSNAFYSTISVVMVTVLAFTLWRGQQRDALDVEDQGDFVIMTPTPLSASLNPDVDMEVIEAASSEEAEEVQASFEELAEELEQELGSGDSE